MDYDAWKFNAFHEIALETLFGSNYDPTKLLEVTFEHQWNVYLSSATLWLPCPSHFVIYMPIVCECYFFVY